MSASLVHRPSFSLCPHTLKMGRELSVVSFTRELIPFTRPPPSWHNHLSKSPPPKTITLGIMFHHTNFGRTQIFSLYQILRKQQVISLLAHLIDITEKITVQTWDLPKLTHYILNQCSTTCKAFSDILWGYRLLNTNAHNCSVYFIYLFLKNKNK